RILSTGSRRGAASSRTRRGGLRLLPPKRDRRFGSGPLPQTVRVSHKPRPCRARTAGFFWVCVAGFAARAAETRRHWSGARELALISLLGHIPVPHAADVAERDCGCRRPTQLLLGSTA